jgi:hypothetical protein
MTHFGPCVLYRRLCHGSCHKLLIPTGIDLYSAVSARISQRAANRQETRVNAASLYRSLLMSLCPYRLDLRKGMEEVVGSIPTRSTNHSRYPSLELRSRLLHNNSELPFVVETA